MPNALTRQAGLRLGPLVLETLIKHYFERLKGDAAKDGNNNSLRQDELLYDEAFNIVKSFLEAASHHTVEEVQGFSNTRTPSPPWVHVVRLVVPMSCCDDAAVLLIKALGGEEQAKRVVGGTKWWQVRGVAGVNSQWITARKDWREAKRRYKAQQNAKSQSAAATDKATSSQDSASDLPRGESGDTGMYEQEMDEMPCILYCHGGGYYFGSVDQERYSIQRHARKIGGRVFAVDYRLAPQYPFPCALQDALAAYLYLIRPPPPSSPEASSHRPVNPARLVLAGDSAGGGLALALLQVLRDADLPMPAGGVLVSPWCDLTHSFLSVHTNTATDVIPPYGLSLQKPSTLWPPPPDEMTTQVHASLRSRIRSVVRTTTDSVRRSPSRHRKSMSHISLTEEAMHSATPGGMPVNVGALASLPALPTSLPDEVQTIRATTSSGEELEVSDQIHFYTQNNLLQHPLVSPLLGYLGGLPPLLWIAGDGEVLRDEIIYAAHKAADPAKYPVMEAAQQMYPALEGIEGRYGPTPSHLQVYDHTAHVLPVLFSFTTPGKFCYRAIASFTKYVTGMTPRNAVSPTSPILSNIPTSPGISRSFEQPTTASPEDLTPTEEKTGQNNDALDPPASAPPSFPATFSKQSIGKADRGRQSMASETPSSFRTRPKLPIRRSLSLLPARAASVIRRDLSIRSPPRPNSSSADNPGENARTSVPTTPKQPRRDDSEDVAGPIFLSSLAIGGSPEDRYAGNAVVYSDTTKFPSFHKRMIRERVSTRGVIRPLEPESELAAFQVPQHMIGFLSELTLRRYIEGRSHFDRKYAGTIHTIEKHRQRNLELAKKDTLKNIAQLQGHVSRQSIKESDSEAPYETTKKGVWDGLMAASGSWSWAWALDGTERPPPSSIVSRRDTAEARRLAQIADQTFLQEDNAISGNNLWQVIVNFLTITPDKNKDKPLSPSRHRSPTPDSQEKTDSKFRRLVLKRKGRRRSAELEKGP